MTLDHPYKLNCRRIHSQTHMHTQSVLDCSLVSGIQRLDVYALCKHCFQHSDSFFDWRSGSVNQACGTFHIDRDLHTTRTLLDKSGVDRSYAYFSLCSSSSPMSNILLPVAIVWKNFPSCQDSEQSATVVCILLLLSLLFSRCIFPSLDADNINTIPSDFIQAHWLFHHYSGRLNSQWVLLPAHSTKYDFSSFIHLTLYKNTGDIDAIQRFTII